MAIVVKDSLDYDYIYNLNRLFEEIVYVNKNEDLLAANMIVTNKGIIGSKKINKDNILQIQKNNRFFFSFDHPSSGGGGAHKCCSNVINKNKEISISEWISFSNYLNIRLKKLLLKVWRMN